MTDRSGIIGRLQFLGAQRIEIGNEVLTPEAERLFALVVRLSVPLGRMTSRQTMMDTLWPGADDANARHNLRQTVYKAREMGLVVESGEDGLRLDPRHWSCDWDDPVGEVAGEWLEDYDPVFSEELAAWVTAQRVGVHALIRPRIIRSLQTARSAGDLAVADRYAVQLLGIDELNEEATLTRAELMAMQGAKVDALKLLDAYLAEIGRVGTGRDAGLPAQLLRRRIAEKLPSIAYQSGGRHHGPLVGRTAEAKQLMAGLFDARAGRGGGMLLHGPEGSGKSRLLHELRKSAVLQGMRVLELTTESAPDAMPFTALRTIVLRLLEMPGSMGITPEALEVLRTWLGSEVFSPDDCPLTEIEDLLAAVSEETPLLLQVEHAERIDAESLGRLDRIYRRGVPRYHGLVLASSTQRTPTESPVALQWIGRVSLRQMTTVEVRAVVSAYAAVEQPRATADQVACAAVFAEGVPMYGIEMLGLMLDVGSPDVIPWRVQVAVDRALRELGELQWRVLALAGVLASASRHAIVEAALQVDRAVLTLAVDGLEASGYLTGEDGVLHVSSLMADGAVQRLKPTVVRMDALRAAQVVLAACEVALEPQEFYACLRLFIRAREEGRAQGVLDAFAGALLRKDPAAHVIFELSRLQRLSRSTGLGNAIDAIVDQVRAGAESRRSRAHRLDTARPRSLPRISPAASEVEHRFISSELFSSTLKQARDPNMKPEERLADAVMALYVASNVGDIEALKSAYRSVDAVRHADSVNPFDVRRADLIYFASVGEREEALACAHRLVQESRVVQDVQLACKGFRNAAEACAAFGDHASAQAFLHEQRSLAADLGYNVQVAWADVRLADQRLEFMDVDGSMTYLESAFQIAAKHGPFAPLVASDMHLQLCWTSLVSGDMSQAQKSAKFVARRVTGTHTGTALWTLLGVKLATFQGKHNSQMLKLYAQLRASIGSRPFYSNEPHSLAALLLFSKGTPLHEETRDFVEAQFPRMKHAGRHIWDFIIQKMACAEISHGKRGSGS
ncbi:MAG: AAA family ATPase [Gemmatimonadota bacterium]